MNRRQKKKQFKKRYGINPPRGISIRRATRIMEYRKTIAERVQRVKAAIMELWEAIRKPLADLIDAIVEAAKSFLTVEQKNNAFQKALCDFQSKAMLQQRQQEREVMRIESNINILNHDRR